MNAFELTEQELAICLQEAYGVAAASFQALEGGADYDARVFRAATRNGGPAYLLKVRRVTRETAATGASLAVPYFLHARGIRQVLAAIPTRRGDLSCALHGYQLILYPFLTGHIAMEVGLTAEQWTELGIMLRATQSVRLPEQFARLMERESYSPRYRQQAAGYLRHALAGEYDRGPGRGLAEVLRSRRDGIEYMIRRAEELAKPLQENPRPFVVCHADLHKWNILVTEEGELVVIDWDSLKLAPKECDLMFIGGNIGGDCGYAAEEANFYRGYGDASVDRVALAYYRYERIVTDIAEFCREVWASPDVPPKGYEQVVRWVDGNFQPGGELEAARRADETLRLAHVHQPR